MGRASHKRYKAPQQGNAEAAEPFIWIEIGGA